MKNTCKSISARAKQSIFAVIDNCIENNFDKTETLKAVQKKMIRLGLIENSGLYNQMLAVAYALYMMKKSQHDGKKAIDCLADYALFKWRTFVQLSDYGAMGDLIETSARIASKPQNLVNFNDLHVKRQGAVDIVIRGIKFEIGTNGKTFLESEKENPMAGHYEKIAYGVFSPEDYKELVKLLVKGQTEKALKNVLSMLYVFDKETFFKNMTQKTGRASMFQYKAGAGKWQVIYNPSKYTAFLHMVEEEKIETLAEWLGK